MRAAWAMVFVLSVACEAPEDLVVYKSRLIGGPAAIEVLRQPRADPFVGRCHDATPLTHVAADHTGAFAVELTRAEVGSSPKPACLRIQVDFPSGTRVETDVVHAYSSRMEIPAIEDWSPGVVWDAGTLTYATASALAPINCFNRNEDPYSGQTRSSDLLHRVRVLRGTEVVWQELNPTRLDEALEDFDGELVIDAAQHRCAKAQFGFPPQEYVFPTPTVWTPRQSGQRVKGNHVPASRGAACASNPCVLTDGKLTPVAVGPVDRLRFDLLAAARIRTVVMRGLDTDLKAITLLSRDDAGVETRQTAAAREPMFGLEDEFGYQEKDGGYTATPLRYVMVTFPMATPLATHFEILIPEDPDADFGNMKTVSIATEISLFE